LAFHAPGQTAGEVKGYKYDEYYPPPHETQMKSRLEGARAQLQSDGRTFLVTGTKLQTFSESGARELIIETPRCTYDSSRKTVSSSGPLYTQTADGKYSIEGEGFLWQATNSSLFISNHVHSVILSDLLAAPVAGALTNAPPPAPGQGVQIFSDQFDYQTNTGLATYRGSVKVTGTNMALKSEVLTLQMPVLQRELKTITAEQDVEADYDLPPPQGHVHATGQHALYTVGTGLVQLTGQPTWQAGVREGSGDELVIDRTNKIFRAFGHGYLKFPGQGFGMASFMPGAAPAAAQAPTPTNSVVEIRSDNYELRTNVAFFRKDVRIEESAGAESKGQMTCGQAMFTFQGTNQLERMVAEQNVLITPGGQPGRWMASEHAVYTGATAQMELTENPRWQYDLREGRGERIVVDTERNEMIVSGEALMRLPASEFSQSMAGADAPHKPVAPQTGTNGLANIFCQEYRLRNTNATFRGGVYLTHPQTTWACESLTVRLPPAGEHIGSDSVLAEQGVDFTMLNEKGEKVHGLGDRALYTSVPTALVTNKFVRLSGKPASLETTNGIIENNLIVVDLGRNMLIASGDYSIQGSARAMATNKFQMPKNKLLK
jgi:lipopolysaccharide export system protein LptA